MASVHPFTINVKQADASEQVTEASYSKYKGSPQPFGRSHEPSSTLADGS